MWKNTVWEGLVAGAVGAGVMTLSERLEQRITGRPNSYVPAHVLHRITGAGQPNTAANWAMHYGQAAVLGVLRSVMSEVGLRGPLASAKFTVVRLTNDQILENATGVGAPPQTWPRKELAVDVLHKAVYAFTTGAITDALAARRGPGPGQLHAQRPPAGNRVSGPSPTIRQCCRTQPSVTSGCGCELNLVGEPPASAMP
ncbi:MAG: hypothetical protein WBQ44_01450 [Rhodococcus sp. (in: high G+C Gram-positive bacteria)]